MPLTIYQASAGSGKTFKITEEYLTLLFRKPNIYKNILAVTFTNKATAEMKQRILKELSDLSNHRPSPYLKLLSVHFNRPENQIRDEAGSILKSILHDYSRFSVETIDRFFQRILRSFVREINLQGTFSIELDQNRVLSEAIENLLLTMDGDAQLKKWLMDYATDRIEKGKSWNIKSSIFQLAREIFNEKFQLSGDKISEKISNKDFLKSYVDSMYAIMQRFESKMSEVGNEALALITNHNLEIDDFQYKKSGVAGYFARIAGKKDFDPKSRAREAIGETEKWYSKKSNKKDEISEAVENGLNALLEKAVEHYDTHHLDYFTAKAIVKNIYTLGIITDIRKEVRTLCEEENIFLLPDAGPFISSIIDGSDAPFVYEKAGTRFHHYMLDEFQDTSYVQWSNFQPLITDSLAAGYKNIVVGDVKQSIYRWRNSSWKILASEVQSTMTAFHPQKVTLESNWRSAPEIVRFNNTIFQLAPEYLQQLYEIQLPENEQQTNEYESLIEIAYAQSGQKVTRENNGYVEMQFFDTEDDGQEWYELSLAAIPEKIHQLKNNNLTFSDIAILIRNQREGTMIADYLMEYNQKPGAQHIPFISNDALRMESSGIVTIIIRAFRYLLQPKDTLNLVELIYHYLVNIKNQIGFKFHLYDHDALEKFLPKEFREQSDELLYLPLPNLLEKIVRYFHLNESSTERSYLIAFADLIRDYGMLNTMTVSAFLDWWDKNGSGQMISATGDQNAVSIVTIHKSKGLEFNAVVIPFCDWEIDHNPTKDNILWCALDINPFNSLEMLPVRYSKDLLNTHFKNFYLEEKIQAFVDNLNLLYVAFTRAKQFLYILTPNPEKVRRKDKTVARLLYDVVNTNTNDLDDYDTLNLENYWNEKTLTFTLGEPKSIVTSKAMKKECILTDYYSVSRKINYTINRHSNRWLKEDIEIDKSEIIDEGKMMHQIFEQIATIEDIDNAVHKVGKERVLSDSVMEQMKRKILNWLKIPEVAGWFQPHQNIKREASILLPDGSMRRPDRVIISNDVVQVVDFKFGLHEKSEDISQVRSYMSLLKSMMHQKVEGFIWYAEQDLIKKVELES